MVGRENGHTVIIDEARAFIQNESEKYFEFLEILKNYRAESPLVIKMPMEREEEKKTIGMEDALSFVFKVKARFQGDDIHVYKSFADNLRMHRDGSKSTIDVLHQLDILFRDHPDLLEELNRFKPS